MLMAEKILRKLYGSIAVIMIFGGNIACGFEENRNKVEETGQVFQESAENGQKADKLAQDFEKIESDSPETGGNMEYVNYLKELLNIDLTDLVIEEEGEYISEDMAYLRFRIADGEEEKVSSLVGGVCGKMDIDSEMLPGYMNHKIAQKLKAEELSGAWTYFMSGSGGKKTRSIELYLTEDNGGNAYLYFFG